MSFELNDDFFLKISLRKLRQLTMFPLPHSCIQLSIHRIYIKYQQINLVSFVFWLFLKLNFRKQMIQENWAVNHFAQRTVMNMQNNSPNPNIWATMVFWRCTLPHRHMWDSQFCWQKALRQMVSFSLGAAVSITFQMVPLDIL